MQKLKTFWRHENALKEKITAPPFIASLLYVSHNSFSKLHFKGGGKKHGPNNFFFFVLTYVPCSVMLSLAASGTIKCMLLRALQARRPSLTVWLTTSAIQGCQSSLHLDLSQCFIHNSNSKQVTEKREGGKREILFSSFKERRKVIILIWLKNNLKIETQYGGMNSISSSFSLKKRFKL